MLYSLRLPTILLLLIVTTLCAACASQETGPLEGQAISSPACSPDAVWAVDLVRTLPDMQDTYLRSIEANWGNARAIIQEQGDILSYRALAAATDTTRGWDVILMTEYADSAAFLNREPLFQAVFQSPEFEAWQPPVPSAEMRTFTASEVTLENVVSSGCHSF